MYGIDDIEVAQVQQRCFLHLSKVHSFLYNDLALSIKNGNLQSIIGGNWELHLASNSLWHSLLLKDQNVPVFVNGDKDIPVIVLLS